MNTFSPATSRIIPLAVAVLMMAMAPVTLVAQATPGGTAALDPSRSGALYHELTRLDSILFHASFVTCDAQLANALFSDDVEFYHDQAGFTSGEQVRESTRRLTGSCPGTRGITREILEGSLQVFPMNDYGAIQMGSHRFTETGAPTSTIARFVHLWRNTNGEWKLVRVLSFDHRSDTLSTDAAPQQ